MASSGRRGIVAEPDRLGGDPYAAPRAHGAMVHRANGDGSHRVLTPADDFTEQDYRKTLIHGRNLRRARAELDAEERAASGDASLFEPVDLLAVADPPPLELGAEGIFPLFSLCSLVGTHNIGKSPLLAFTGLERIRAGWDAGECFGVYELEMGPVKYKRLLRDLGATDAEIARFRYYSDMMRPADLVHNGRALCRRAWQDGCRTLAYDSLISMLAVSGLSENDPVQVRSWYDAAARPMTLLGGSALCADHSGLDDLLRGRGTSDKDRAVDFTAVMKCVGAVGKRGVSGEYELKCTKDRDARLIGDTMGLGHKAADGGAFTYAPDGWTQDISGVKPSATQDLIKSVMTDAEVTAERGLTPTVISAKTGLSVDATRSALRRGETASFTQVGDGTWTLRGLADGLPGGRGPSRGRGRSLPIGGTARPRGRPRPGPQATKKEG
ncbi:MAG: hypothetical protein ACRDPD_30060 [Streptosporangiaceae bacterium]